MPKLTEQMDNLNKRVNALENSELAESDSVPFIIKMYGNIVTVAATYCSEDTECSEELYCSGGAEGAIEDLALTINYGAVGAGAVPVVGDTGLLGEVQRKPMSNVTVLGNEMLLEVFFDETDANGSILTNAAMLYKGTNSSGTGTVILASALNLEKTSAKTLTLSGEITVTEV